MTDAPPSSAAPTDTPRTATLSDAKQRLLDRWLAGAAQPAALVTAQAPEGPVPATGPQRRMWLHARLYPDSAAYHIGQAVRLTGPLDEGALRATLAALVERHDALRTTFTEIDDEPYQVVAPRLDIALAPEDGGGDRDRERAWLSALDTAPFDLEHGPLVRFGLLRHSPTEHVLMTVVHHAVADGLSLVRLLGELGRIYAAFSAGAASPLPPPALTHADYARWRLGHEEGPEYAAHLADWCAALGPEQPRLDLPTDRPRPPVPGSRGVSRRFVLDAAVWRELRELARRHRATPYMAAVAGFTALLHRLTGQSGIAVGSVVHGRDRAELEELVGCFADTVVLHTDVEPELGFAALLDRVRDTCTAAYARQDVPLDAVASELRWDRSPATGPVPQVLAVMQQPPAAAEFGPLRAEPVEPEVDSARFDLVLNCWEADGTLHGAVTGNADLFDAETVGRWAARLARLLSSVVEGGADTAVDDLDVLPDEEGALLRAWGRPVEGDDPLVDRDLAALVRDAARRDPEAVAVECGDERLTYSQLLAGAQRLATALRAEGAGPDTFVGVLLERGPALPVALLGVLETGAAFVALDTSWPRARTREIAAGAGLRLVVGAEEAAEVFADGPVRVVPPDAASDAADDALPDATSDAASDESGGASPEAAVRDPEVMERVAYVIHTSGSTGAPKGVMIRQQAICNRMRWQIGKLGLDPSDAVLHKAPLGFDISLNEIFLPLVAGARLVLAPPGHDGDVDRLLGTVERHRVTFLYIVASMLDVLLERDDAAARLRSLRHLWCGGEALTGELYARFRRASDARMYHGYGPAETTIGVSCRVFEPGETAHRVSIGRPNPNARLYVLDGRLRPVPVGVRGELHVGGLPLARGYLNDPERTAERFVGDPFDEDGDGRMYRTGDLARFRADGEIEFLGRLDDQVKIRGFRVEPGEVSAALARHPGVRAAAVLAREAPGGGHELIAYCSLADPPTEGEKPPAGEELRGWLNGLLPGHAVPRDVRVLPELPLTSAGKVDRKALAALPEPGADDAEHAPPARGVQRAVADIWTEVLGTDRFGVHDNFFDLGGHSLLVLRVQTLLRQRFGREIPLLDLLGNATVARLAGLVEAGETSPAAPAGPAAPAATVADARSRALRARDARALRGSRRRGTGAGNDRPRQDGEQA
ncbi:amino acid adenylation domain-containing protein [Streptomyces sp. NPDC050560]|uniref:amino acid adenylation domain-containing protein n=1 Tax=Streptomyces sp. NPDC050560 TaxID=3365630 RepID=UPI0037B0708B